jgi:hypothetical protein
MEPSGASNRTNLVVNFGGLSSWMIPEGALVQYAAVMTECITAAASKWPGGITVCSRYQVLSKLRELPLELSRRDITFADLDHRAYLSALQDSRALISSAGLHAIYEAVELGVPCVLLPAQNLSQALAIPTYRRHGFPCMDWDSFYPLRGLSPAKERKACKRIAKRVAQFERDSSSRSRLVQHLRSALQENELLELRQGQARFIKPFAERGASRISRYVLSRLAS